MTPMQTLLAAWDWEPSVVAGCLGLALGYVAVTRCWTVPQGRARALYFFGGVTLLLLDLVSPLDAFADGYLFSAHVVQHFLLSLVIPPLLLLGLPPALAEKALRRPAIAAIERSVSAPRIAWTIGIGTMILWQVPVLFNAALSDDGLHVVQHLSFLVSGTIFWWPVLHPLQDRRLPPVPAVPYLFSACLCCTLLGAWLAFAPLDLYPAYLHPQDQLGLLGALRGWGFSPGTDRQLGGLLMWIPGCFVYLTAILANLAHWYNTSSEQEVRG